MNKIDNISLLMEIRVAQILDVHMSNTGEEDFRRAARAVIEHFEVLAHRYIATRMDHYMQLNEVVRDRAVAAEWEDFIESNYLSVAQDSWAQTMDTLISKFYQETVDQSMDTWRSVDEEKGGDDA